mmetsp:Transcript_37606/g.82770  ORF Transcript_37606/g.82770 Transcript_37606/m.82770 type:complete len:438 (+) Transcript_37606:227-1540(+)
MLKMVFLVGFAHITCGASFRARPHLGTRPSCHRSSCIVAAAVQPGEELRSRAPMGLGVLRRFAEGSVEIDRVPCAAEGSEECYALCDTSECSVVGNADGWDRAKLTVYFGLWYLLSVGYSVTNKHVTNALPLPWTVAAATVVVGSVFVGALWASGAREPPRLSTAAMRRLLPIGAFHAIGHIAGTVGTAAGSVSFAQVVKSTGPVYACVLSALVLRQSVSPRVWLSLLPIVGGVALATLKELSFAWVALAGAVVSDLALALRNVYSKASMDTQSANDMPPLSPANHFGVLTCVSAAISVPLAVVAEGPAAAAAWRVAAPTRAAALALLGQIGLTGLYFYGYSEVAMKALKNVHPVTHAIGNTLRRVIIMLVCMLVFRTPMTAVGAVGSALAVGGSYIYAMVKTQESQQAAQAKSKQALLTIESKIGETLPMKVDVEY